MRRIAAASLLLFALAADAGAQKKFDYITFDKIKLDPNYALATTTRWGILVNTGTEPISLENDWEDGLWYGESSDQLGNFFWELLNPFGGDFVLQPGEAVGDLDPLLVAELLPGETIAFSGLLIAHLQFGVPFPTSDFSLTLQAQVGDQIAKTQTDVEIADLGGAAFWEPVSARRWSCELSPATYAKYGHGCHPDAKLKPLGDNAGSGPPYVAYLSNMPQIGNWAFGVQIKSPIASQPYVVGVDTAPGNIPFAGCQLLLALSPTLLIFPGQMSFFQETQGIPIPDLAGLIGLKVYLQSVLLGASFLTTNGIELTLADI